MTRPTGIPFCFKQWAPLVPYLKDGGACPVTTVEVATPGGSHRGEMARVGKKTAGRQLDGRTWHQFPAGYKRREGC